MRHFNGARKFTENISLIKVNNKNTVKRWHNMLAVENKGLIKAVKVPTIKKKPF